MKKNLLIICLALWGWVASDAQVWNPAQGVFILQRGDLYQGDTAAANLYYTRYADVDDRVKMISYRYNGLGYFRILSKDTIARTNGADGIIHHPDGDLLVAGQANGYVHKVNQTTKLLDTSVTRANGQGIVHGLYHLMMDPSETVLWAAGIPGYLYKFPTTSDLPNHISGGILTPLNGDDDQLCTIAWDENGKAFYTRSQSTGYGYFGTIDMTTMTTKRLTGQMNGPHGMAYDSWSKTIFLFGNSHIIQIDPVSKAILVDLDFNSSSMFGSILSKKYGGSFQFDQGTTDGEGHIFVADNNGSLVFIDFTSNSNKRIDNNILVHVQFLDTELDDVAPLSGAGSEKKKTTTTTGSGFTSSSGTSSSSNQLVSSSSKVVIVGSSGSDSSNSSSSVIGSSSSDTSGGSGTSVGGGSSSSDAGGGSGTSVGGGSSSSDAGGGSGTSVGGGSSSSDAGGGSGTSVGGGSSSSDAGGGSGTSVGGGSSSDAAGGSGYVIPPWADPTWDWGGGTGVEIPPNETADNYPSADNRIIAETVVSVATQLIPASSDIAASDAVVIGGNTYKKSVPIGDPVSGYGSNTNGIAVRGSVPVGGVLALTIDPAKLIEFFGLSSTDSLQVIGSNGLSLVNPNKSNIPSDSIQFNLDGSSTQIWILADSVVSGGLITFKDKNGKMLVYDGINFYDPIPIPEAGLLKDTNGDGVKDAIEIFLDRPLPMGYDVQSIDVEIEGQIVHIDASKLQLNSDRDRLVADVAGTVLGTYTVKASDILKIHFTDGNQIYDRTMPLKEVVQGVISRAVVIRSLDGRDSLFVEFNIDITANDLAHKSTLVRVNSVNYLPDLARLPAKRTVIFEAKSLRIWNGSDSISWTGHDSIQLQDLAYFDNLPYIVDEEYNRKVPIQIITRLPALSQGTGYFDANGDGVMDSVVFHFADTITSEQLALMNFTIPWYSFRNRQIQLMPNPADLVIDPNDPTVVSWKVQSNTLLREGLTSIPSGLAQAELYVEYPVFESKYVERRTFVPEDHMSPAITEAKLRSNENGDTLTVKFSEPVDFANLTRKDLFKYWHGDSLLVLRPQNLIWADDGLSVQIALWHGQVDPVLAGDFLVLNGDGATGGMVIDALGNAPLRDTKGHLIDGALSQMVNMSNLGTLTKNRMDSLANLGSMSIEFVDGNQRTSDLREQGKIGQLVELGQRFLPQLVEQSGVNPDSLDPKDVSIAISTYYFDNLGQYVTDTVIVIPCDNPGFGHNCLDTDKKVFINWHFKDNHGRYVGSGVYVANFTLYVRYQKVTIKEESTEKVGVRRTK